MATTKEILVKNQLMWDNRVTATDIAVTVTESTAELSGTVPTFYQKVIAEDDALSVAGIRSVLNNLNVSFPENQPEMPDSKIKETIDNILMWDTRIDPTEIEVSVKDGIVTLEGTVNTYWKKYETEKIAFGVTGVVDVKNNLNIDWKVSFRDESIEADVKNAIERSLDDIKNIQIKVEGGVVTLSGSVNRINEKRKAEEKASFTAGVKNVINNIQIE